MAQKKNDSVIAVCIQEPFEDGSSMDFGVIKGDALRFLHQAFITDTINHALDVTGADVRLYYIDQADRRRLVKIVSEYLGSKLDGKKATAYKNRFDTFKMKKERWGLRIENIFVDCFEAGYEHVLVIGSRTPTVRANKLKRAIKALKESDAVFGPTPEGRYYVIGMSGSYQIPLSSFDWKSPKIYSEVSDSFSSKDLAWSELEIWYCVEDPDHLEIMVRDINQWRFEGDDHTCAETEVVMERILAKLA